MKKNEAFPSQYISKEDLSSPVVWTIVNVKKVELEFDGTKDVKPAMFFQEVASKPLLVNTTNWIVLEEMYGMDSDDWKGKPVELYADPNVMFGGKRVGGVRVRVPNTNGRKQQVAAPSLEDAIAAYQKAGKKAVALGLTVPEELRAKNTDDAETVATKTDAIAQLILNS